MPDQDALSYAIGPLLRRAHSKAAHAFDEALEPLGIQGKHFGVLMVLNQLGAVSQRQLTDRLGSDKSAIGRLIDDLEAKEICRRRPDPADRRAHSVELTVNGRRLFRNAEKIAEELSAHLLASLEQEDQQQLILLLRRFVAGR